MKKHLVFINKKGKKIFFTSFLSTFKLFLQTEIHYLPLPHLPDFSLCLKDSYETLYKNRKLGISK